MPASPKEVPTVPGDALLHPAAIAAVALLLANDHVLKKLAPGLVTGKLSDVAGLAFFPLLLTGLWEVGVAWRGRWSRPSRVSLFVALAITAASFAAIKTTSVAAAVYAWAIGGTQAVVSTVISLFSVMPHVVPARPASVAMDPSDLVALVALVVPLYVGVRRLRAASSSADAVSP